MSNQPSSEQTWAMAEKSRRMRNVKGSFLSRDPFSSEKKERKEKEGTKGIETNRGRGRIRGRRKDIEREEGRLAYTRD